MTPQYTVSEIATRTGFSPSTLRYYDKVGLVVPTARSGAGYRLYDERAVERLGFVARAKRLGLDLHDIAGLLELWDGDECAAVHSRLTELVASKRAEVEQGLAELGVLADDLAAIQRRLAHAPHPGPCDDSCACLGTAPSSPTESTPVVCDLRDATDTLTERVDAYRQLFADAYVGRDRTQERVRFRFRAGDGVEARVRDLVARETRCCDFFAFTITADDDELHLHTTVTGGEAARAVLDELYHLPDTIHRSEAELHERFTARGLEFVGDTSTP